MEFEITIKKATLAELRQLVAILPEGTPIKAVEPVETVHARVVETDTRYHSKWQIPFSCKTHKKEYQNAWNLCKKHNLPYPEAKLKAEAEGMNLKPEPSPVTNEDVKPIPAIIPAPVTMDTIPNTEIIVGRMCRQIKPDRLLHIKGPLKVTARRGGLIECQHEGKRHMIDAKCLTLI
jgi:hypothetical protein